MLMRNIFMCCKLNSTFHIAIKHADTEKPTTSIMHRIDPLGGRKHFQNAFFLLPSYLWIKKNRNVTKSHFLGFMKSYEFINHKLINQDHKHLNFGISLSGECASEKRTQYCTPSPL